MHRQLEAEEVLIYLIQVLLEYLEELAGADRNNKFLCGEQIAYVECLEIVQLWEYAEKYGLNFNIEELFPLF